METRQGSRIREQDEISYDEDSLESDIIEIDESGRAYHVPRHYPAQSIWLNYFVSR